MVLYTRGGGYTLTVIDQMRKEEGNYFVSIVLWVGCWVSEHLYHPEGEGEGLGGHGLERLAALDHHST